MQRHGPVRIRPRHEFAKFLRALFQSFCHLCIAVELVEHADTSLLLVKNELDEFDVFTEDCEVDGMPATRVLRRGKHGEDLEDPVERLEKVH